jgi:regulator of sirC expression with transglutaminase-like and TPR domain
MMMLHPGSPMGEHPGKALCNRGARRVTIRFDDSPEFQRMLAGARSLSLMRIALEIARDAYPELEIELYLGKVNQLADRIRARCTRPPQPRKILAQINWALFVEEGYEGNRENYFDPRNSYLNEVIDRKTGIPISLSVLYWTLAEQLGLPLEGVNLPAHFMLRLSESQQPLFIDPFHSGEFLDQRGCERRLTELTRHPFELSEVQLAPCPVRMVVARMLRNLKAIYLGTHDFLSALDVQRRLAAVASHEPLELRDLGMICLQVERPGEAIDPLQAYLDALPEADDAESVADLLKAARRMIARWN